MFTSYKTNMRWFYINIVVGALNLFASLMNVAAGNWSFVALNGLLAFWLIYLAVGYRKAAFAIRDREADMNSYAKYREDWDFKYGGRSK